MRLRYATLMSLGIAALTACANPGDSVVLYQPQEIVGERLMNDVSSFATFIQGAQKAWSVVVTNPAVRAQMAIVVVIGVDRDTQGWIVGETESTNANNQFTTQLRKISTPPVSNGVIAFAVTGSGFKNRTDSITHSFLPPMPQQWRDSMKNAKGPETIDELLIRLIPKKEKEPSNQAPEVTARKLAEPQH